MLLVNLLGENNSLVCSAQGAV